MGCGDSSPLEVRENTQNYVITCNNIGGTGRRVVWDRGAGVGAGACPAVNDCRSAVSAIAVLSRPSYSTSTMTVRSATRLLWGNKEVKCYTTQPPSINVITEDSCTLDVVCEYMRPDQYILTDPFCLTVKVVGDGESTAMKLFMIAQHNWKLVN